MSEECHFQYMSNTDTAPLEMCPYFLVDFLLEAIGSIASVINIVSDEDNYIDYVNLNIYNIHKFFTCLGRTQGRGSCESDSSQIFAFSVFSSINIIRRLNHNLRIICCFRMLGLEGNERRIKMKKEQYHANFRKVF